MKQFTTFLIILIITVGCKKDDPETIVRPIVGSWLLTEREQTANGKTTWIAVADSLRAGYTFREDGAVLMGGGFTICCHPKFLSVNGKKINAASIEKQNMHPMCEYANCAYFETWYIEVQGDELILSFDGKYRTKYVRNAVGL